MAEPGLRPADVFQIHSLIRWTSLVTDSGEVLFSETRPGVKSLLPEGEASTFIEANRPKAILSASENLSIWAGGVRNVVVEYENIFLYATKLDGKVLAVSCEKTISPQELSDVSRKLSSYARQAR